MRDATSLEGGRMVPSAGTRLGPYEILAPLGAGGMGEVCRATDTRLARDLVHNGFEELKRLVPTD